MPVNWKQENDIPCMNWPPQSPDINIIENIWKTLKNQIKKKCNKH